MYNLLLYLATFAVRTDSLIEGTILVSISLNLDFSYVDAASFVVFIFDTTIGKQYPELLATERLESPGIRLEVWSMKLF